MYLITSRPIARPTVPTITIARTVMIRPMIEYRIVETACLIFSSCPPERINEIPPTKINTTDRNAAMMIAYAKPRFMISTISYA